MILGSHWKFLRVAGLTMEFTPLHGVVDVTVHVTLQGVNNH